MLSHIALIRELLRLTDTGVAPFTVKRNVHNKMMCGCRTGRQPDPNRTSYDAYLYAFLIDVSLNASPLAFLSATCAPVRYVIYLGV